MADIRVGGASGEDGLNYIGNIGEVWIDKNNKIRRSDGATPGGVIQVLGGGTPFSGDYNDLTNKPSIPTPFSGDYNNLTNKPSIPTPFSGDYNDLTNSPTLFDGAYGSLSGRPDLTGIDSNNAAIVAEITRAQTEETSIRTDYVAADVVVTNSANTYTDTAIANLVDTAPATLDTLNELAAALGDDPNFATTVTNQIAALTHDDLTGFVANEHIDWTAVSAGTIDPSNYTNTDTTYPIHYWSGASSIGIGNQALHSASVNQATEHSVAVGTHALGGAINGSSGNVAIGSQTLQTLTTSDNNIAIGLQAGLAITSDNNIAIGVQSMADNETGTQNTAIGGQTLRFGEGDYNVALGHGAGSSTTGSDNLLLGHSANPTNVSDKLYISNRNNPHLITGDFSAGTVTFNNAYTFPTTDGTTNQVLTSDGAGNLSWTTVSGGSSYSDSDVETYLSGGWDFHLLPDTNATYDIGSAEYKVRHLFLSDNSLYIGDNTLRTSGNNLLFDGEDVQDYNNLKNKPDLSAIATNTTAIATKQASLTTGTAPATSKGAIGDTKGTIIIPNRQNDLEIPANNYIYYCYRNFPRTTDYTVEVKEIAYGNAFKITTLFTNWPDDIYEGVRVWTTDVNGDKASPIGWVEHIADLSGDTYIVMSSSSTHTAGDNYVFEYSDHSSYGVNIWQRMPFDTNSF